MAAANANYSPEPPPATEPPFDTTQAHLGLPILVISIIGILIMSLLLVSYYAFAIKCSANWRHSDVINRFRISRPARRRRPGTVAISSNGFTGVGLGESEIRAIPIVQFRRNHENCECSICLTEFGDSEKLKFLPNCAHVFHIDCIGTWLQANLNCPICRTNIIMSSVNLPAPPQHNPPFITIRSPSSVIVVVDDDVSPTFDIPVSSMTTPITENRSESLLRKLNITSGEKAEEFSFLHPMRRSVSMDFLRNGEGEEDDNGGRHLFRFGDCRSESSRSCSVLPIDGELKRERRQPNCRKSEEDETSTS